MARVLDPHTVAITMPDGEPPVEAPNVAVELTPDDLDVLLQALRALNVAAVGDPRLAGHLIDVIDVARSYARPNR